MNTPTEKRAKRVQLNFDQYFKVRAYMDAARGSLEAKTYDDLVTIIQAEMGFPISESAVYEIRKALGWSRAPYRESVTRNVNAQAAKRANAEAMRAIIERSEKLMIRIEEKLDRLLAAL